MRWRARRRVWKPHGERVGGHAAPGDACDGRATCPQRNCRQRWIAPMPRHRHKRSPTGTSERGRTASSMPGFPHVGRRTAVQQVGQKNAEDCSLFLHNFLETCARCFAQDLARTNRAVADTRERPGAGLRCPPISTKTPVWPPYTRSGWSDARGPAQNGRPALRHAGPVRGMHRRKQGPSHEPEIPAPGARAGCGLHSARQFHWQSAARAGP